MFLRKLRSVVSLASAAGRSRDYYKQPFKSKHKDEASAATTGANTTIHHFLYLFLFLSTWFLFIFFYFRSFSAPSAVHIDVKDTARRVDIGQRQLSARTMLPTQPRPAACNGRMSVYVYDLPSKFNKGLVQDCHHLNVYTDMCPHVANRGLGQPLHHMDTDDDSHRDTGSSRRTGGGEAEAMTPTWFATHQFIAEMIFHARVENHPCRTWEPDNSTLFYVPFYGGLHSSSKFREADLAKRDELAVELVGYIANQKWWKRRNGRDHFLALGRTAWDFMRSSGDDFGANCLLNLPHVKNMSVLTVERHPWKGSNQFGIPYPSYFHPSTLDQMLTWQERMRNVVRPYLFSFVGAPRKGVEKAAIRDEILRQCAESERCNFLKCGRVGASKCHDPKEVLNVMSRSEFCMQAPGDSFTRRSTFDSILAGCIPVFFSPHTAYTQYSWFLPKDTRAYSVYIPEEKSGHIEELLLNIPRDEVKRMRKLVINLIPKITYIHPNASVGNLPADVVDLALAQLSKHVLLA